jgi:hypothetical protein
LKTYGSSFGKHGYVDVISGPALVDWFFSSLRRGGIAPWR